MKYKCIIFDLDGTIYFGNQLAKKANEVILLARNSSEKIFFITNNSAKTRKQIYDKLLSLNLNVQLEEVITSSYAISQYLKYNKFKEIYCVGTDDLKKQLLEEDINIISNKPEVIVVGYNKDFNLSDLEDLANINTQGCKLIVANKERTYPKENGYIMPGAGPIVGAVEVLLNKNTDIIIGKPNIEMIKYALKDYNYSPKDILIVGDSYDSDVKMAQNYGANCILITEEKRSDCKCIKNLSDLLEILND